MKRLLYVLFALLLFFPAFLGGVGENRAKAEGGAIIDPLLTNALERVGKAEVIVTFKGDQSPNNDQLKLLQNIGIDTGAVMNSLPIAGVLATKSQVEKLAANDQVHSLYLNKKLSYFNAEGTDITGVDKLRTDDSFRKANGGFPVSGKGVGVVVNDSGVDGTHKDHELGKNLVQNVMASTNLNALAPGLLPVTYQENVANTDTNSGHGTHVAGTVGGTGAMSSGKYEGVAPGADLIGYGSGAALFVLDGIGGFDYAITNQQRYGIRVITNSWGSSGGFDPNHPINIASKKAYDRGITVLFAAGNEGPGENTHNPYAKAPWVISVAAGVKDGTLADFSSRGTKDVGGHFTIDGEEWSWKDEPTVTAPGVDIVSTRVLAPVSSLAADQDAENLEPAHLPYYTHMSGTSMATPHVAGIVALLLEANPNLSPAEIKDILQKTATNMPGHESWEVGAGYVNAYAAIDMAFNGKSYGGTVNAGKTFNSNVDTSTNRIEFSVGYDPLAFVSPAPYEFTVEQGISGLVAKADGKGLLEETGNLINLVLIAPDGKEYSSGVSLLFPLYTDRTVSVQSPMAGKWKLEIRGLRGNEVNPIGAALPETVEGTLAFSKVSGFTGLNDIGGHPAAEAIQLGVNERLFDGLENGAFKPDAELTRSDLAKYLVMGAEIRQSLPASGSLTFKDVTQSEAAFAEAASAKGAAFRDQKQIFKGVMLPKGDGKFAPKDSVNRAELAYSLIQSLGLQKEAVAFSGRLTVQYKDERITIEDADHVPDELKGYVQLALDMNIINAKFSVSQGPYDLKPTVKAVFSPQEAVKRGDFAVAMVRYYNAFLN
ncbi:S8 family serine peptidase [Cytobacillus oceanisediminis]|uniref:S8 family serine peptidase n=1 Tax=Cytobacillus oceanisediminis TaxID=665099 RepID=UPI00186485D6|nr:S8 family serine peptidase [Cytobacillus oceanisediminis]MCM3406000.1 S8 family serine peptidase [Cytobacillus oceanisediminis]MDK7667831.1 S8 family serine peptidase [Cytobacillus oceanisediminis]QOK26876.1 S8 family serine peptidase [Cytobacillus oceanisediminis]